MIGRFLRWVALVGVGYAVVTYTPDVARYLRLRQMSDELRAAESAGASTGPG